MPSPRPRPWNSTKWFPEPSVPSCRRAVTIMDAEQLGGAMMDKLAELFDDDPLLQPQTQRGRRRRVH